MISDTSHIPVYIINLYSCTVEHGYREYFYNEFTHTRKSISFPLKCDVANSGYRRVGLEGEQDRKRLQKIVKVEGTQLVFIYEVPMIVADREDWWFNHFHCFL